MTRWRPPRKAEVLRLQSVAAEHQRFLDAFEGRLIPVSGRGEPGWHRATGLSVTPRPAIVVDFPITRSAKYEDAEIRSRAEPKTRLRSRLTERAWVAPGDTLSVSFAIATVKRRESSGADTPAGEGQDTLSSRHR